MNTPDLSLCAACGKDGENLKVCTACKSVKYCNVTCQKSHRKEHKKACRRRAAELFDELLFKWPPPKEDCPICFLRLPSHGNLYQECCGKLLCIGCAHQMQMASETQVCPFCRGDCMLKTDENKILSLKKRMKVNDARALFLMGEKYINGSEGIQGDPKKGLELWSRAVELGATFAHYSIGEILRNGKFMRKDQQKALYHYQQGALGGCELSRHNLGCFEADVGNWVRAIKHWIIAAGTGNKDSLGTVKNVFKEGYATRVDYERALRVHQKYLDEVRSDARERGAARCQATLAKREQASQSSA